MVATLLVSALQTGDAWPHSMISSRSDIHPLISTPGRLRTNVPTTRDLIVALCPLELVDTEFPCWQQHARDNERGGLASLNKAMFMSLLALLVKMGLTGLRRRERYWQDSAVSAAMSLRTSENLLYTIKDAGFHVSDDPLKRLRRFVIELHAHWQEVYLPGFILVADETMVGWKGATNIHITVLPQWPTGKGVCLKTLVDGHTCVMTALEFVESKEQQGLKRYSEEGKAAAVTLRLTEPWHNKAARIVIAESWFGSMPTAWGLM
jgi:hypothetical protein